MHCGNGGIDLTEGSGKTRFALSAAKLPKIYMNKLSIKGVIIKKIIFLGFLKVRMKFFLISNPDC